MVHNERRTSAVRRALEKTPTSIRALAREAGIPHPTLVKIRGGTLGASGDVARAVLRVLRGWSLALEDAAAEIEESLTGSQEDP